MPGSPRQMLLLEPSLQPSHDNLQSRDPPARTPRASFPSSWIHRSNSHEQDHVGLDQPCKNSNQLQATIKAQASKMTLVCISQPFSIGPRIKTCESQDGRNGFCADIHQGPARMTCDKDCSTDTKTGNLLDSQLTRQDLPNRSA